MSDIEGKVTRVGARERGATNKFQIVEDLQAALAQFAEIASDLKTLTQKGVAVELDWFNQSSHYGLSPHI